MITLLALAGLLLSVIPAALFFVNLPIFLLKSGELEPIVESLPQVSVLIPARDEQYAIEGCIRSALASEGVDVEVVVLDDQSTDGTAEIVQSLEKADARVRYVHGELLADGWNGKQFACFQLARVAAFSHFAFLDADVRLRPQALQRFLAYQAEQDVMLLSAFPHQETGTWLEKWLVPMMHVILLGYLPLRRMRESDHEAYAAGCGQLFLTTRDAYQRSGTHEAIKSSRHDGLKLPRAYRRAGLTTDVVDGTRLATCRMYRSAGQVVVGVLKNAHEGIANGRLIVPFSILLLGSAVLPVGTLFASLWTQNTAGAWISALGVVAGHLPRAVGAVMFRQRPLGVVFHSLATLLFVCLQWVAFGLQLTGRSVAWRGRTTT